MTSSPPALSAAAPPSSGGRSAGAQRVLDATLDLFSEHGFEGTSLQDIADRLGVTKAAVYYHFHTKDELLLALIQPAFDDFLALVAEAENRQAGSRAGRTVDLGGYVEVLLRHRRVTAWLTRDATAMTRAAVLEQATQVRERTEAMLVGRHTDALGAVWGSALMQALPGALLAAPADASDEWLREELTELGAHLLAGYRKAVRRREA
ncbi:TetR/AcrR family transcriptional regulator [Blastococcus sp. URHD0036]|uniref:TetR/AcrR family transcriptional regulator n=1 Tax=Blastococcus sp. URHD0036 TaxID=1380356 RepID=UPI00068DF1AA|nr:TetR/AcrR family transcriptional regulator [Blastococcus sp. URHD0036]